MVESPSLKATRKDSVLASPDAAVEYEWRMVAGRMKPREVLHAEVGGAMAKRARGERNFMVVLRGDKRLWAWNEREKDAISRCIGPLRDE